jgi:signal recognition particle subunit SRP54
LTSYVFIFFFPVFSVAATQSPIIFIGTGEHLHDLDRFEPKPFIRKMLGMGDMRDLVETVQDMGMNQNKNLMENIKQGKGKKRFIGTKVICFCN